MPSMVAHDYNLDLRRQRQEDQVFETTSAIVDWRLAWLISINKPIDTEKKVLLEKLKEKYKSEESGENKVQYNY